MSSINILSGFHGLGLARDADILARLLRDAGHEVWVNNRRWVPGRGRARRALSRWLQYARKLVLHRAGGRPLHAVNVFLQDVDPAWIPTARRNLWIPNPDFARPATISQLDRIDAIFCKTRHAMELFAAAGPEVRYVGFTSLDRRNPAIPRSPVSDGVLHVAGRSWLKGTGPVVEAWRAHPEWPRLTLVTHGDRPPVDLPNVDHVRDYLPEAEFLRLQNTHAIHLCPSETEGFGHYLVEAMACEALVMTTDAPPMNELVRPDRGVLLPWDRTGTHELATTYHVARQGVEEGMEAILDAGAGEIGRRRRNARAWFEENDRAFRARFPAALDELT